MSSESDFLEIIILGAIAAFLIYRLVSTLGQNSGFQQPIHKENPTDVMKAKLQSVTQKNENDFSESAENQEDGIPDDLQEGISFLKKNDPNFSLKSFLDGATNAYEMIVKAFAEEDLETLKNLMDKKVYADFKKAIEDRQQRKMTLETTIIRLVDVRAEKIEKEGSRAAIAVTFVTEQNHLLKDESGQISEGSPRQIEEVTDVWTFAKSLRSQNPNWSLVATGE